MDDKYQYLVILIELYAVLGLTLLLEFDDGGYFLIEQSVGVL